MSPPPKPDQPMRTHAADLFRALSTEARWNALKLIGQGKSLDEIAKRIGMSRTGFQRVLDDFESLELTEPAGHRSYRKLSAKGVKILELLRGIDEKLRNIEMSYRKSRLGSEIETFLPFAERSFPGPVLGKLKEAWEFIESEGKAGGE